MSDITNLSKDLAIYDDIMDSHHGQLDGIIKIGNTATDQVYAYLEYSLYIDTFNVNMIKTYKEYQRKGYATLLMNYVKKHYGKYQIRTGYTTDEGAKLMKATKTVGKFGQLLPNMLKFKHPKTCPCKKAHVPEHPEKTQPRPKKNRYTNIGLFKGDAEKGRQAKIEAFSRKYKKGDIVFSPIYRECRIVKMNAKTVAVVQVDAQGNPIVYKNSIFKPKPLVVEKYLFTV